MNLESHQPENPLSEQKLRKEEKFTLFHFLHRKNFSFSSQVNFDPEERPDTPLKKTVSVVAAEVKPLIDIYNDPLLNEDGTRNLNIPFCLYVSRKQQEERENNKNTVSVSNPSCKENVRFQKALQQMKAQKKAEFLERRKQLRRLEKAKSKNEPKFPVLPASKQKPRDGRGDAACFPTCQRLPLRKASQSPPRKLSLKDKKEKEQKEMAEKLKALKKARVRKQLVKYPPVKTKPWKPPTSVTEAAGKKKKARPVIVIPPFKTKKWVPESRIKPREKVVIEYPPVIRK